MTTPTTVATDPIVSKKNASSVSITFPGHKSITLTRDGLHVAILAAKANIEQGRRPYWVERLHAYQAGLKLLQAGEKGEL
jgi:hypothetical protein